MIERTIVVGLVCSTEYAQQIVPLWDPDYLESNEAYTIADWCIEYFNEYGTAPGRAIQDIYFDKKRTGDIPRDLVESVKEDMEDLLDELQESFNLKYALDKTKEYFRERHLELHQAKIKELMDGGEVEAAELLMSTFKRTSIALDDSIDLSDDDIGLKIKAAFKQSASPLIEYSGALGRMLNDRLIRGAFVSLMASEKRGKSFWLLDMAIRGTRRGYKVAFFQAGDMTEGQQIKRTASYLAKLPTSEKYTGEIFIPQIDCLRNQLDDCDKPERQNREGVFTGGEYDLDNIRKELTKDALLEAYEDFGGIHRPCRNCQEFHEKPLGVPWLEPIQVDLALDEDAAVEAVEKFFVEKKRRFKLSTHPNSTLSVPNIRSIINGWEKNDNFIPDIIIIDYADLLIADTTKEFRHQQNEIWKDLRALSQERNCLVLTATQADAKSYETNLLKMTNFSEDKRKFAHVTAMFGLNQDKYGREKKLGIMRVNELVIREGEFDSTMGVTVLQSLNLGRPSIGSYI